MSQENVEIVREVYRADSLIDSPHFASEAEFDFTAVYPDQPVLRGTQEMRSFRDAGPWGRSIHFEPERFFDVDDTRVLVLVGVSSTGRTSGTPVETRIAHEVTIRDQMIVHIKIHRDQSDALKAVGLAE